MVGNVVQATIEAVEFIGGVCGGYLGLAGCRRGLDRHFFCTSSGLCCLLGYAGRCICVGDGSSDEGGYVLQDRLGQLWQCDRGGIDLRYIT